MASGIDRNDIAEIVTGGVRASGYSGIVMVRRRGEVEFAEAFGLANRSEGIPNTIETRFAIASGTKTFTAVSVLKLLDRGRLRLDTRLSECLPDLFPEVAESITVEHLLTHRSGVPDYADEERGDDYGAIWIERPCYGMRTPADFLPLFRDLPMKFAPGERFGYSNAGYVLLGLIVERSSGRSYCDYVEEEVLAPAGMKDSGFFELDRLPENTARGYIPLPPPGDWKTNVFSTPARGGPDGGMYTTGPDLLRFHDALRGHRLLLPGTTALLAEPRVDAGGDDGTSYGYGLWFRAGGDRPTRVTISGGDPGAEAVFDSYPDLDLQVVHLSNTQGALMTVARLLRERFETPAL